MEVKSLKNTSFNEIIDCFLKAFENYFVALPTDRAYYLERWKASKVDFSLSFGMFDNDKLVGFILHAIDKRFGVLTAYNAGTGVVPAYRGQRIVKSIYSYALKELKQSNIGKSTLEVITKNEAAFNTYLSIGFKKSKIYKCFAGSINVDYSEPFEMKEVIIDRIEWNELPNQEFYSWDNQKESIVAGQYKFFKVLYNNEPESYFIIKPESGYIAQLDVLSTHPKNWHRLFCAIKSVSVNIKYNNVDERLSEKINQLESVGLINVVDQFEMELAL